MKVQGQDLLVNADRHRLEQVLSNLLANARRYALGRVVVTVRPGGVLLERDREE